jgi:hypothetical protein
MNAEQLDFGVDADSPNVSVFSALAIASLLACNKENAYHLDTYRYTTIHTGL